MQKANASGTCLQGYVDVSYNRLVEVFGEPHYRMGDKSTVEWSFEHEGVAFTLYDYKWQSAQSDLVEGFHVGGTTPEAVDMVRGFLDGSIVAPDPHAPVLTPEEVCRRIATGYYTASKSAQDAARSALRTENVS